MQLLPPTIAPGGGQGFDGSQHVQAAVITSQPQAAVACPWPVEHMQSVEPNVRESHGSPQAGWTAGQKGCWVFDVHW